MRIMENRSKHASFLRISRNGSDLPEEYRDMCERTSSVFDIFPFDVIIQRLSSYRHSRSKVCFYSHKKPRPRLGSEFAQSLRRNTNHARLCFESIPHKIDRLFSGRLNFPQPDRDSLTHSEGLTPSSPMIYKLGYISER
jgi:hypothetical protein